MCSDLIQFLKLYLYISLIILAQIGILNICLIAIFNILLCINKLEVVIKLFYFCLLVGNVFRQLIVTAFLTFQSMNRVESCSLKIEINFSFSI